MTVDQHLRAAIDSVRATSFVPGYQASDAECLGLAVSRFFEWDGIAILETSAEALEDANFHTECAIVTDLIEKAKKL